MFFYHVLMLNFKKYIFFLPLVFLIPVYQFVSDRTSVEVENECESYISIHGSSNINQFQFFNDKPQINQTDREIGKKAHFQKIKIPVEEFTGSNIRMLHDFFKMVKADEHPDIQISMEPRAFSDFDETTGMTNFRINITLAGNTRNYVVPCHILFCDNSGYILKGDMIVKLTDFEINPPQKIFGAIKVNNEVFINFAFRLKNEESLTDKITF